MLYPYMSSAPHTLGRPSSPLNPNPTTSSSPPPASSSRFSSGSASGSGGLSSPSPMSHKAKTRYRRPDAKKYIQSAPAELFAEGTTPTEGLMWRERFSRRMEDREKRRKSREAGIDKRRAVVEEEDDDDAKAREDDEEIFRRLMILQRKREQRAAQISYELDNGGSDPISPEFWEEEGSDEDVPETVCQQDLRREKVGSRPGPSNYQTPQRPSARNESSMIDEEDRWAIEAARAEEAEREAEEAELARQIEESYTQSQGFQHRHQQQPQQQHHQQAHQHSNSCQHDQHSILDDDMAIDDIEMDWDVDMDL